MSRDALLTTFNMRCIRMNIRTNNEPIKRWFEHFMQIPRRNPDGSRDFVFLGNNGLIVEGA